MNTVDDLRTTLRAHADATEVDTTTVRAKGIHDRIRTVQRRRRSATIALAAVAVVAAGSMALLPRDQQISPSDQVGGHEAPPSMISLGSTYTFAQGVAGDDRARLELKASTHDRLLSWASGAGDARLELPFTIGSDNETTINGGSGDFDDFHLIPAGTEGPVIVTGTGSMALGVYDLSEPAPGVGDADARFRDEVAGSPLLAAAIGDQGQRQIDLTFTMPEGRIRVVSRCSTTTEDRYFTIDVAGAGLTSEDCQSDGGLSGDLSEGGWVTTSELRSADGSRIGPGDEVSLRASVVDGLQDGIAADLGDGRIAVAVYAESPAAERVGSYDLSRLVERDGHLWRLRTVQRGGVGAFSFIAEVSAEDHPVLTYIVADRVSGRVRTVLDGKDVGGLMGSGGAQDGPIVWPGDNPEVGVVATRNNPRAILAIAEYERVD